MMSIQIKYQREINRLEKEIKTMKKQILLRQEKNLTGKKQRKIKVRGVFLYIQLRFILFCIFSTFIATWQLEMFLSPEQERGRW